MTPFLGILFVLLFIVMGVRLFSRSTILKAPWFSGLIVSGLPYILTGVLLGPQVFNFFNPDILSSLEPLISLAMGWVGLLFGLQLRWRNIHRFPPNYLLFTTVQTLIAFGVILAGVGLGFYLIAPSLFTNRLEALIILAALGSMTAPLSIGRLVIEKKAKGRLSHLIQFVSSLDSFWGILIAGITLAIYHPPALRWFSADWQWVLLSLFLGIFIGLVFRFLIRLKFSAQEIFLLVVGLVIFTSGIGFYLRLSPVMLNLMAGIAIAQFPRESEKVMRVIHRAEKPTYLCLLLFAGAYWNFHLWQEILLIILFILMRYAGKYWGGRLAAQNIDCAIPIPLDIGKGLLSFGGIALAIALNFQLFYGGVTGDFLMSATIVGILVFDEYATVSITKILRSAGEAA